MNKHLRYARYLLWHKWYVFLECCKLGIPWLGVTHDLSKLLPDEWVPNVVHFYGLRETPDTAFNEAWGRHLCRNKHHPQWWWVDDNNIFSMPDRYRRELLADLRGSNKALGFADNTLIWYEVHGRNMKFHPETRAWLEGQLGL